MAGLKQPVPFEIQQDAVRMLEAAVEKYQLRSVDKALRCILDYVATDGDWDDIFGEIRCIRCGGLPGWTAEDGE